ncbi:MAG: T9SS type A sorting domain-containing protein [Bacteroidota bacterium]
MKKAILFSFVIACLLSVAQPYQVGHRQQSFTDPSRNNRVITTEIYYPAKTAGDNVAIAAGQFPVLVFGHGFVMTWSAYDVVWNALVPSGYIMVFPTTETSFSPSHTNFGKDIAFLVGAMKSEALNSASPFFNSNSGASAVMGHSMGGGSAFLAVQYDNTINALATLAAANTNPSSISAASSITIPSIVFSGGNDCVTPPGQHQIPMYDSLISSCKTFVSITGGSHCQFANYNASCYFGEGTCSPQATITPASQQTTVKNTILPWLDFYLKGNCSAGTQFQSLISAGTGITSQQNCTLVCNDIKNPSLNSSINISPNPTADYASLSLPNVFEGITTITVVNQVGDIVMQTSVNDSAEIVLSTKDLSNGIYFIRIINGNKPIAIKKWLISK